MVIGGGCDGRPISSAAKRAPDTGISGAPVLPGWECGAEILPDCLECRPTASCVGPVAGTRSIVL
jgi:hypothetical protein